MSVMCTGVIDCGTSETKFLKYVWTDSTQSLAVYETAVLGSLRDCLLSAVPSDIESFMTQVRALQASCEKTVLGVSAWFRDGSPSVRSTAEEFFRQHPSVEVVRLTPEEEGRYEAIAVAHAARRSDMPAPDVIIGSGGGSIQFTIFDGDEADRSDKCARRRCSASNH